MTRARGGITFVVTGAAVPKGRPRVVHPAGGRAHAFTPERTRAFEELVHYAAMAAYRQARRELAPACPIALELEFTGAARGDIDNLAKAVMDGLEGVAYANDRQVVELAVRVRRGGRPARTSVTITDLEDGEGSS